MKKILFILSLTFTFAFSAQAQFEVDRLFGGFTGAYAKPIGGFSTAVQGGISFTTVAGYSITDKIGVGVEYGGSLVVGLDSTRAPGIFGASAYGFDSYLAKGWYRFTEGNFKPYTAVGLGLAKVEEPEIISADGSSIKGATRYGLGANVELGVAIKGFNLAYAFNVSGKAPKEPLFNPSVADLNVNYHQFRIGYILNVEGLSSLKDTS